MGAQRFFYRGFEDQPTTRVAVTTVGFDDVYVMLLEWTEDQRANLRIFVNPLVTLDLGRRRALSLRHDRPRLASHRHRSRFGLPRLSVKRGMLGEPAN